MGAQSLLVLLLAGSILAAAMPDSFFWPDPSPSRTDYSPPAPAIDRLAPDFYQESCPSVEAIARSVLEQAMERDPRAAASILRLHFHDCFVDGCDGSILLDDAPGLRSEKAANPNRNSARGFDVVDEIKAAVEQECEDVVSCADLLAIAARDSVVLSGGFPWQVYLGRRDSVTANLNAANSDIPAPNSTLPQLVASFARKGLSVSDMVTLSGSHTIGFSRCASFSQRLYNHRNSGRADPDLQPDLLLRLRHLCPRSGGDANAITVLDAASPARFDASYFANLRAGQGVLASDQALLQLMSRNREGDGDFSEDAIVSGGLVEAYAYDQSRFLAAFADSMVKLGNIGPLTGERGQVRRNCRVVNFEQ